MKILLCCSAGMSTSMVVRKMQEAAAKEGKSYEIKAVDSEKATSEIGNIDVLLLGPQVKYLLSSMEELGKAHNVPVAVMNQRDYAMCNGKAVLKQAEELVKQKQDQ